jgi:hypothetical protein
MLVGLSLHVLARGFQRGFDNSAEALAEDFGALAGAITDTVAEWKSRCPGALGWLGNETYTRARILAVRSFLSSKGS